MRIIMILLTFYLQWGNPGITTLHADENERYADHWVATDALGRTLPSHDETGARRSANSGARQRARTVHWDCPTLELPWADRRQTLPLAVSLLLLYVTHSPTRSLTHSRTHALTHSRTHALHALARTARSARTARTARSVLWVVRKHH